MPYTAAQLTQYYTNVNQGVAPDAATTLLFQAYAQQNAAGTLSDTATLQKALASTQTTSTTDVAVSTYNFFTGTTPTAAGLAYLVNSTTNTTDLNDANYAAFNQENRYYNFAINLAVGGAGATAFAASYGTLTLAQTVQVAYEKIVGSANVTNSAAAIADITSRIPFFTQVAAQRAPGLNQDIAVKAVIIGYILNEGIKADVGTYAKAIDGFNASLANGTAIYGTDVTVTYLGSGAGVGTGVGGGTTVPGSALVLTTGLDALVGTAGDDTVTGTINATAALSTLTLGDTVNGGAGSDTLNIVSNVAGATAPTGFSISNVETVNVTNAQAGAAGALTFDATLAPGATAINASGSGDLTVTNIGSAAIGALNTSSGTVVQTITAAGANKINVSNNTIGTGGALNIDVSGGTAQSSVTLQNTTGTAGTVTGLTIQAATTALVINAGSAITIGAGGLTAGALKTVVISGGAASTTASVVTLGTLADASLVSVDASGLTAGGASLTIGANAATTFKGGAGIDTVTIANGVVMTGAVDGGAGTADVIGLGQTVTSAGGNVAGASLTAATKALFTNFEILQLSATASTAATAVATDTATFDASQIPTGVTSFRIGTSNAGLILNNLAAGQAVDVRGNVAGTGGGVTAGLTLNLKDATGTADVQNIVFTGTATAGRTLQVLSTPGVETINITSTLGTGASQNTITSLKADASLTAVNITGAGPFSLTTGALTKVATINGAGATGSLNIDGHLTVAQALNINGGSANDTIITGKAGAGVAAGLIVGNGGGDAITVTAGGVHTLQYKAAADSLYDVTGTAGASATTTANAGKMDVVTGFVSGTDKLDLTAFTLTTAQQQLVDKGTFATTDAMSTAAGTAGFYTDSGLTVRGIAQAHIGGDTYLFVDVNKDGAFSATTDLVVKLTGTAALTSTDIIGQ
jgi:S-layer protein